MGKYNIYLPYKGNPLVLSAHGPWMIAGDI